MSGAGGPGGGRRAARAAGGRRPRARARRAPPPRLPRDRERRARLARAGRPVQQQVRQVCALDRALERGDDLLLVRDLVDVARAVLLHPRLRDRHGCGRRRRRGRRRWWCGGGGGGGGAGRPLLRGGVWREITRLLLCGFAGCTYYPAYGVSVSPPLRRVAGAGRSLPARPRG